MANTPLGPDFLSNWAATSAKDSHGMHTAASAAVEALLQQLARLDVGTTDPRVINKMSAMLGAWSDRASSSAQISSSAFEALQIAEFAKSTTAVGDRLGARLDALSGQIKDFTAKADSGTTRLTNWTRALVFATWGLVVAALVAAGIQAYAIWIAAPQIINITRP